MKISYEDVALTVVENGLIVNNVPHKRRLDESGKHSDHKTGYVNGNLWYIQRKMQREGLKEFEYTELL